MKDEEQMAGERETIQLDQVIPRQTVVRRCEWCQIPIEKSRFQNSAGVSPWTPVILHPNQ